jgi:2-keto-3-deoxy-6-phosphogluconate aldolase
MFKTLYKTIEFPPQGGISLNCRNDFLKRPFNTLHKAIEFPPQGGISLNCRDDFLKHHVQDSSQTH